jgi:hypothetical protein
VSNKVKNKNAKALLRELKGDKTRVKGEATQIKAK